MTHPRVVIYPRKLHVPHIKYSYLYLAHRLQHTKINRLQLGVFKNMAKTEEQKKAAALNKLIETLLNEIVRLDDLGNQVYYKALITLAKIDKLGD